MKRGISRQLSAVLTITWMNGLLALRRMPLWVASYLLTPLSLLFFLAVYGYGEAVDYAMVGGAVMVAASNGVSVMGDAAFYRIYAKYQDLLVATPTRPVSYVLGLALSMLVFSAPGLAVFVCLMWLRGLLTPPFSAALALCVASTWASSSFIGFAISTLFRHLRHVWPLTTIMSMLLAVLPPVYYPATLLPQDYRWIGALAPTGAAAMMLHHAAGLINLEAHVLAVSAASVVCYVLGFMLLSTSRMRWREK
ncbi:MAG: ABC transporter permease [Candidatus Nezhaarchaeota archaeon]|nr:ABC transporter permease [Candidatus Nezhaarchaeota archaeon]